MIRRIFLSVFFILSLAGLTYAQSRGMGGGGTFFSASISPHDPQLMYVTTDMSAVYKTTDFGLHWETIDFRKLMGGHNSNVRFTSDPQVLYSVNVLDELDYGIPVKSTDGGNTWTALEADPTYSETYSLYADPGSTNRVIISDYSNLFFSSDGGAHFSLVYEGSDLLVGGVFWDGSSIFVGTQEGLLVSTDNGANFSVDSSGGIPSDEAIVSFAGAKEDDVIRLFAVTGTDAWPGITAQDLVWGYSGIYRLQWGQGGGWTDVGSGMPQGANPYLVGMAINDIDTVYVAGGNVDTSSPIVYKTVDSGNTWSNVFLTSNNQNIITGWCGDGGDADWWYPELAFSFAVSPNDPSRAAITDYGFVHVTDDGGDNWRQAYVESAYENSANSPTPTGQHYSGNGLEDTSSWWLQWVGQDTIIAAFTDIRGMRSEDGGATWAAGSSLGLPHNSTYHVIGHPSGVLYAATSEIHDLYESTRLADDPIDSGEGSIIMSSDDGQSWQTLRDFGHPVIWLALDPYDSNTMYASVVNSTEGDIYVTHNLSSEASALWTRLASPPRTEGHPFNIHVLNDGSLVATYSGRMDTNDAFTASSGVFLSTDGGANWLDRSDAGMMRWTKDIVVDPHDAAQNTWYVSVFSHWGSEPNDVGGLYRTTDRGVNWTRISDLYRVESCTIDPDDPDVLYLATETEGLWRTEDLTDPSPSFTQLDYPFRHPTRIFYNPSNHNEIWVTSFGNGMRTLTVGTSPVNGVCGSSNGGTFATAPTAGLCSVGTPATVSGNGPWTWSCQGSNGGATANCSADLASLISVPTGQQGFAYSPVESPGLSVDAATAKPIGLGQIATGGDTLSIRVGLEKFLSPVDVYLLLYFPEITPDIYLWTGSALQPLSSGLAPWKQAVTGPLDEALFGDLSVPSLGLPQGTYYLGLLLTPAGVSDLSAYYLWVTQFDVAEPSSSGAGLITYTYNGQVYRIAAAKGATPENISTLLDKLSTGGGDGNLNISPNGDWLVLETERFDPECNGWACLALVNRDVTSGGVIRAGGNLIHGGQAAVDSTGNLIVFSAGDGAHTEDLWKVERTGGVWAAPVQLTSTSTYTYNNFPALSDDGSKVVFECGNDPYMNRAVCEVGTDGTGLREVLPLTGGGTGSKTPDYAPNGDIILEIDQATLGVGETINRIPAGGGSPVVINASFTDDNSPCVLPDGRIVSLWLNRPGGQGFHELKVMDADGGNYFMLVQDIDVDDVGLGCGE